MKFTIHILTNLFALMPLSCRVYLGYSIGVFLRIFKVQRKRLDASLSLAMPELTSAESAKLKRDYYRHIGLLVPEFLSLPALSKKKLNDICEVRGMEHVEKVIASGKGAFVLAGHTGSWELGLANVAENVSENIDSKISIVVKEIKGATGDYFANLMRINHKIEPINRRRAIRGISKTLKGSGFVGFVLDQNMTNDEGIFVDFFGEKACTMSGLALLALRYKVPVLTFCSWRCADNKHHIVEFQEAIDVNLINDNKKETIHHFTQLFTTKLENIIRAHPEQWIWMHKRWKTRPKKQDEE